VIGSAVVGHDGFKDRRKTVRIELEQQLLHASFLDCLDAH
jgi:hypothetical protein